MKNSTNNSKKGNSKKRVAKKKTIAKPKINGNLVTKSAFARLLGISAATVGEHVKKGHITLIKGKIDPELAKKELLEKIDVTHGRRKAMLETSGEEGGQKHTGNSFNKAKAFKEGYKAKLAELEYKIKIKEYVKASDVEHAAFSFARRIRDKMLNIPDRVEADIAAITGMKFTEVGKIIKREIEIALKGV